MNGTTGDVLLLACYELGHQPLSLAWPAAVLRRAGIQATPVDLTIDPLPHEAVARARFVGISVPMHTALRLGVRAAEDVRRLNPHVHICFFGLYAWLNADHLLATVADSVIAGELEEELAAWVVRVLAGEEESPLAAGAAISTGRQRGRPGLTRLTLPPPDRTGLPDLSRYARYVEDGVAHLAGYVEASRGCLHTCRHCPVVPVYGGRFFVVPVETVLADIRQQVAAGAEHITFGDPDFLNGPGHVLRIARSLHAEFPRLTFDFTTKVEHILKHRAVFPELRSLGARFVVSAFESVSDEVLSRLQKGHTRADLDEALAVLDAAGLPVQPTLLPFTPWAAIDDYIELLVWIRSRGLIAHVPAVQLSVRLLVPPGSALLHAPDAGAWLGPLDAANFTHTWQHPDPCMDELQRRVAAVAERGDDVYTAFASIEQLAYGIAGRRPPLPPDTLTFAPAPPRLTEDWFC